MLRPNNVRSLCKCNVVYFLAVPKQDWTATKCELIRKFQAAISFYFLSAPFGPREMWNNTCSVNMLIATI